MTNLVVCNTKGGVGKTNISLNVLPLLLNKNGIKNITYYHLDNNNEFDLKSNNVTFKQFKKDGFNEAISEAEFLEDDANIIDCGGGDDSLLVLDEIAKSLLKDNLIFIIPVSKNLSIRKNVTDTINAIKEKFNNPKIFLFFNYMNKNIDVEDQYKNIFGNEVFNIAPLNIDVVNKNFGYVVENDIFEIVEFRKTILLDKYLELYNVGKNDLEYLNSEKQKMMKDIQNGKITKDEGLENFKQIKNNIRQAKVLVELAEEIINDNEKFLGILK